MTTIRWMPWLASAETAPARSGLPSSRKAVATIRNEPIWARSRATARTPSFADSTREPCAKRMRAGGETNPFPFSGRDASCRATSTHSVARRFWTDWIRKGLLRRVERGRGIDETKAPANGCRDDGTMRLVVEEVRLELQAFVVSPFQGIDEGAQVGDQWVTRVHAIFQRAHREEHAGGKRLSGGRKRLLGRQDCPVVPPERGTSDHEFLEQVLVVEETVDTE